MRSNLLDIIEAGHFWNLSDSDLLHALRDEFPEEIEFLKHAYSVRPLDWKEQPGSPSRILFPDGDCYDEINRSLVGVLALRWINDNDYEQFTGIQAPEVRLSRESFEWIRHMYESQDIINSKGYKLYVLVTSMVTNDLGKSGTFKDFVTRAGALDNPHENHDMILHRAVQKGLVPAIERLLPEWRDEVKRGIKLGGEFNVGQLAQAENVPASLAPLLEMTGHVEAWNMRWMEQMLDISGAAGHEDHNGCKKFIDPIFRSYSNVYDIVLEIIEGRLSFRQGYDLNLKRRYDLILRSGWKGNTQLDCSRPEDRTIMRLFCNGNVVTPESADLYHNTFYSDRVGQQTRQRLVEGFGRDGTVDNPAIQLTYGPGMCALALSKGPEKSSASVVTKERMLAAMYQYFGRVLTAPPKSETLALGNVTVIERDIRVAIKHIIESQAFRDRPEILADAPLPEDVVANTLPAKLPARRQDTSKL